MSFIPKAWRNHPNETTPITAEDLNRIEKGVELGIIGPPLDVGADLLEIENGTHQVLNESLAGNLGLPTRSVGVLTSYRFGRTSLIQTWMPRSDSAHTHDNEVWQRAGNVENMPEWTGIGKWYRGHTAMFHLLPDLDDLDNPVGVYTSWSISEEATRQLPTVSQGILEIFRYGNSGALQRWTPSNTLNFIGQVWVRTYSGVGWTEWKKVGGSSSENRTQSGSGFKTIPLAVTTGRGNIDGPLSEHVRWAIQFNAPITRWRLYIANRNARYGTLRTGSISFDPILVGKEGANGEILNPITIDNSFTTDGSGYHTPWTSTPIDTNEKLLISTYYNSSVAPYMQTGASWRGSTPENLRQLGTAPFEVWIEAETPSYTPVVSVLGSSSDTGLGGTRPIVDSTISKWAREHDALPIHYAHSGDSMSTTSSYEAYKFSRWAHLDKPDSVLFALGSNDVYGGATQSVLVDRHKATMELIQKYISKNVYGSTVFERWTSEASGRVDYNSWLKTLPHGLRDIFDFAAAIGAPPNPEYNGDGIHPGDLGHDAIRLAITRPLTAPALLTK